jgi:hypothetical protein
VCVWGGVSTSLANACVLKSVILQPCVLMLLAVCSGTTEWYSTLTAPLLPWLFPPACLPPADELGLRLNSISQRLMLALQLIPIQKAKATNQRLVSPSHVTRLSNHPTVEMHLQRSKFLDRSLRAIHCCAVHYISCTGLK